MLLLQHHSCTFIVGSIICAHHCYMLWTTHMSDSSIEQLEKIRACLLFKKNINCIKRPYTSWTYAHNIYQCFFLTACPAIKRNGTSKTRYKVKHKTCNALLYPSAQYGSYYTEVWSTLRQLATCKSIHLEK